MIIDTKSHQSSVCYNTSVPSKKAKSIVITNGSLHVMVCSCMVAHKTHQPKCPHCLLHWKLQNITQLTRRHYNNSMQIKMYVKLANKSNLSFLRNEVSWAPLEQRVGGVTGFPLGWWKEHQSVSPLWLALHLEWSKRGPFSLLCPSTLYWGQSLSCLAHHVIPTHNCTFSTTEVHISIVHGRALQNYVPVWIQWHLRLVCRHETSALLLEAVFWPGCGMAFRTTAVVEKPQCCSSIIVGFLKNKKKSARVREESQNLF